CSSSSYYGHRYRPAFPNTTLFRSWRLVPDTNVRTGGACGLLFVMVGSAITTSPRVVIAKRYCCFAMVSSATRKGPTIGSRITKRFCRLKKYVSNARILVSGDAANTIRRFVLSVPPHVGAQGPLGANVWL